jgi:hypothetical protein
VDQQQQSRWRPTRRQVLWTLAMLAVLTVAVLIGYRYDITLWDWIKLLIVPTVIAGGGLWFNVQQREREQRIASLRAQDAALQGYLDGMSQLLTDKEQPLHKAQPGDPLSTVARAQTLTMLARLDSERKGSVMRFLYESDLITEGRFIVDLRKGDLREADLRGATLFSANLSGTDLSRAVLIGAFLNGANLSGANLSGANLVGAFLIGANLSYADLSGANLVGADLSRADLSGAAGITNEELDQQAGSLEGATMPTGPKYEDWIKSNDRGKDG